LSVLDSLIEATALHWNLTLVTRNTADFAEVEMVNPWG
jgi:predicted nucleic acid-binding protein